MPRTTYRLNIELVNRLLGEEELSQGRWAIKAMVNPSTLSGKLDARIPFAEREGVSLATLRKLAGAIGYEDKYMQLTLGDDGKPYRSTTAQDTSVEHALVTHERTGLTAQLVFTETEVLLKIAAPSALIDILKVAQWNEILKHLISAIGTVVATEMMKGSVVLIAEADNTAKSDLIHSFLAWRLQYVGIHELQMIAPSSHRQRLVTLFLSHFTFADPAMHEQCATILYSQRQVTLATQQGLQITQLRPLDPHDVRFSTTPGESATSPVEAATSPVEAAWKATCYARDCTKTSLKTIDLEFDYDERWDAANYQWQPVIRAWKKANQAWKAVLATFPSSDEVPKPIRKAKSAVKRAKDAAETHPTSAPQSNYNEFEFHNAVDNAIEAARTALESMDALREQATNHNGHDLWRFRSTLLPVHIHVADHYWNNAVWDRMPEEARFPGEHRIDSQPAVLLDDETFFQPQYQPS